MSIMAPSSPRSVLPADPKESKKRKIDGITTLPASSSSTKPTTNTNEEALYLAIFERRWNDAMRFLRDNPASAKYILDREKYDDLFDVDDNSSTPRETTLLEAIHKSATDDVIKSLIQGWPEGVRYQDEDGRTMLHYAAEKCSHTALQMCMEQDESCLNIKDNDEMAPIQFFLCNNIGTFKSWLDKDEFGTSDFQKKIEGSKEWQTLQLFLKSTSRVDGDQTQTIHKTLKLDSDGFPFYTLIHICRVALKLYPKEASGTDDKGDTILHLFCEKVGRILLSDTYFFVKMGVQDDILDFLDEIMENCHESVCVKNKRGISPLEVLPNIDGFQGEKRNTNFLIEFIEIIKECMK